MNLTIHIFTDTFISAVFQAGGLVVVLVEVGRKAYLGSIVPVIVNAILNEHQIIVDIVAFVSRGDFPRSRLGEKQRGKILAGWVSRKMRTIAQFSIRDMDAETAASMEQAGAGGDSASGGGADNRASIGSARSASGGLTAQPGTSSSLRNMEPAPQILEQRELEQQLENMAALPPRAGAVEMSADDMYSGGGGGGDHHQMYPQDNEVTPTKTRSGYGYDGMRGYACYDDGDEEDAPPTVGPKPGSRSGLGSAGGLHQQQQQPPPTIHLPSVDGRESLDEWQRMGGGGGAGVGAGAGAGGKMAGGGDDEEDWTRDAIMHMNLAGDLERKEVGGR